MNFANAPKRAARLSVLMLACMAAGLAAGGPDAATAAEEGLTARLKRLFTSDEPAASALPTQRIDCPVIQVEPGQSAVRVGGAEPSAVRYQIAIGDVARECAREGDRLAIRVGVETRLVLGAAGSPGSYSAPLRVAVRRQSDESVVASKTYRVGGAVRSDGPAQFTLIADPLIVPFTTERAADDYEIVLGFGGEAAPKKRGKK